MKKLLLLLLCLILTGCAETYDGPRETRLVLTEHSTTFYGNWDTTTEHRYTFSYDVYGNVARTMAYVNGELETVTDQTYDDRGNVIRSRTTDHTGWIPLPDGGRDYTYDDRDRCLTTIYRDGWGRETGRSTYTYDDEARTRIWSNGEGDTQTEWLDEEGRTLRAVADEYESVYEYDDRGNYTSIVTYKDGALFDSSEYRYDEQNRNIYTARYDEHGTLTYKFEYRYDDEQHTMTQTHTDGSTRIEYYDSEGRIQRIEDYREDGTVSMIQRYYYQEIQVPQNERSEHHAGN